MRYWLVEANDRSGAVWGFLVGAEQVSARDVAERIAALGRAVEISGQVVDARLLDLKSLRVRYDATERHKGAARRWSLEGEKVD